MTVGLIAGYQQAEDIIASGKADMICLARGAMWDPRWAWHAAEELGAETPYAPKMMALPTQNCGHNFSRNAHKPRVRRRLSSV